MNRDEWTALAARCESTAGPDREIDAAITLALFPYLASGPFTNTRLGRWVRMSGRPDIKDAPGYTAPTPITALIGREFPQFELSISVGAKNCSVGLYAPGLVVGVGIAVTEALARTAAFCRVMAARAKE
jgi:hypothetical protein